MGSAAEAVTAFFNALGRFDSAAIAAVLHDDLRFERPWEPETPALDKASLQQKLTGIADLFQRFDMNIVETIEAADPRRVVVRYDGDCLSKDGSLSYCNNYIGTFTVVDGRIAQISEYTNPLLATRMSEELGAIEPG